MFLTGVACSSTPMNRGDGGDAGSSDTVSSDGDSSEDGTAEPDARGGTLCNGEQHLRLWALIGGGGMEAAASYVRIENGLPVITIDGTCTYWVGGGWSEDALSEDRPFHTGRLSDADVRAIEESVPLDDIATLSDCEPNVTVPDGPTFIIRTAKALATCGGITTPSHPGTRFLAAWATMQTIARASWQAGAPVDGALHVSAVSVSSAGMPPPYAWPIAAPLDTFVPAAGDLFKSGVSRLVDDPDSARKLRAMREQYLADWTAQPMPGVANALAATDQSGLAFLVYMRDAIPYEDAQGLLKF